MGGLISGLGGKIGDLFKNRERVLKTKTDKPRPEDVAPGYRFTDPIDKRCVTLADNFYREGTFEKIQFARKWMRNALMYQGYHELEWSEINVAWDVMGQDSSDFAFPNNYYRTLVMYGVAQYLKNEPMIEPQPANDDAEAQAATKAAKAALEVIKRSIKYDQLRVPEAINLRLFGNSFRFNYYSKDPRYGYVNADVYQDTDVLLSHGGVMCPQCGPQEGLSDFCPQCQQPTPDKLPPITTNIPKPVGTVKYPKGEICTEIVNPLEIYARSSCMDIWHVPFLIRNRIVDRMGLQAAYPDITLTPRGDDGGEAYSTGGDLGLIYMQSLADLPGDPTQYAAWYERATAAAKALLIECWVRPSQYYFDKELIKQFPDGLYIAKTGDTLLEARNDTIEDHWTHYVYMPVPGRLWGDGDDDLIPGTLKLDETDRLISRNQGYNSAPLLAIDSQRIDKNEIINDPSTIIEVKPAGKPVSDAIHVLESQPLSQETWAWRNSQIQDMQFHSRISPAAVGQHETGVNTFGGQESAAAKSDSAMLPQLALWKTGDELWARQVLKLAAENWLDDRINAVMGINGRWEFSKLKGSALNLDKINIITRVMPIDPSQQDAMSQAVASGALDPQDPRVKRKMMELFHLPVELDQNYMDQKSQWEEIELMKQTGQQIQPTLIMDNDAVHIDTCRVYWNSDEAKQNPQVRQLVQMHAQLHIMNMLKQQQMSAVVQGGGQQAAAATGAQPQQPGGKQPEGQQQPQQKGGQVPKNPVKRQQRAEKGAAAKPNRPQNPSGNQYNVHRLT